MLMICWFYCVPFVYFLYYAIAPLLIFLSFFIFKRGICRNKITLRILALFFIFVSSIKIFVIDLQNWAENNQIFKILFFAAFVLSLFGIYRLFKIYGKNYIAKPIKKQSDKELRIWANTAMMATIILICWQLMPWVGYLIVGRAFEISTIISWHLIAIFNFVVLTVGFWLSEEYYWFYYKSKKGRRDGAARVWVPSDTLWLTLSLYLIAVAFGVMSDDVL